MKRTLAALLLALSWSATAQAAGWPALTRPAPQGGGEKDAALVVGIEQYAAVASVPGAAQNAKDWFTWLRTARGVPLSNVTLLVDSEGMLEKIRIYAEEAASKVKPGGTLWFVFIVHGAPAKDGRDGLLVGYDAQQDPIGLYARSLPQAELRELLSKSKASRVVMVLDACFSGKTGSGSMIAEGLQPLIALKRDVGAMAKTAVVLTAGKGDQFAGPLPGEKRPAFSYLMLGALRGWADRNGDGKVTAEEAIEYANEALTATVKGRRQTPELEAKNPNAILATGAKESGPDLDEIVLQTAMGARAPEEPRPQETPTQVSRPEVPVVVPQLPVSGGDSPANRLYALASRLQDDKSNSPQSKSEAWCQLAQLPGENPYADVAKDACGKWRAFIDAERRRQESLAREYQALKVFLDGGQPKAEKLVKVELFLAMYGGDAGDARVAEMRELTEKAARGEDVLETIRRDAKTGMTLIKIPAGTFSMGCEPADGQCDSGEKPARRVEIKGFWLGKTEVSVAEYAKCVEAGACDKPRTGDHCNWGTMRTDHPINCVYFYQAIAFCKWIGGRLPNAQEWEYAAKGGESRLYPWGNEPPNSQRARFESEGTAPVVSYGSGASRWGLLNMAGNVSEWISAEPRGNLRELRGGGWDGNLTPDLLRASTGLATDHYGDFTIGFRCAQ